MRSQWWFEGLIALFPAEYRVMFGTEILGVLLARVADRGISFGFVLSETAGLLNGAANEWIAKLGRSDYSSRPRPLTEASTTEPVGSEIDEAEQRIRMILNRMEYAIAHHQFERARLYSFEERRERANLQRLQNQTLRPDGT